MPKEKRTARFVCNAIAAAMPNGDVLVTRETIEGYIGEKPAREVTGLDMTRFFMWMSLDVPLQSLRRNRKIRSATGKGAARHEGKIESVWNLMYKNGDWKYIGWGR